MAAPVLLVAELVPAKKVERLPRPATCEVLGLELPLIALAPFEASAIAKVRIAMTVAKGNGDRGNG